MPKRLIQNCGGVSRSSEIRRRRVGGATGSTPCSLNDCGGRVATGCPGAPCSRRASALIRPLTVFWRRSTVVSRRSSRCSTERLSGSGISSSYGGVGHLPCLGRRHRTGARLTRHPTPIWAAVSYGPRRVPGIRANLRGLYGRSGSVDGTGPRVRPQLYQGRRCPRPGRVSLDCPVNNSF